MKLPRDLSGSQVIKSLERQGFQRTRQKGSHVSLARMNLRVTVPLHKEIRVGTLRSILDQSQLSIEQLLAHI